MATRIWRGDAPKVAQVDNLTLGGTWENNDNLIVTINGKSVTMVSGSTVIATILASLLTQLQASVIPEFREITWTSDASTKIVATAVTAGKPFTITVTTTENGGGAADSQTFAQSTVTANSGPNDINVAANWSGATLPTTGDTIVIENAGPTQSLLYNLSALSAETFAAVVIKQNFTGFIGLPKINTDDSSYPYYEYRADYFTAGMTLITIGEGIGGGSGRIKLNVGSVTATLTVLDSGAPAETGLKAILWKGTDSGNAVEVNKGSLGIAVFAGETANVSGGFRMGHRDTQESDADVFCGTGVTFNAIVKNGGRLTTQSAITTATLAANSGDWTHIAGAVTTITANGGTIYYRSNGTVTTANLGAGSVLDFSRDPSARTVTTLNVKSANVTIRDPNKTVTWTNTFTLPNGVGLSDCSFDFGKAITLAVT